MEFEPMNILLWIIVPYALIAATFFVIVFMNLRKLEKKLAELESKLVQKVEKENIEKRQARDRKLMLLKNDIDQLLQEEHK
jgi:cytochrome c-type biogenesis protein CcmH/NrfF